MAQANPTDATVASTSAASKAQTVVNQPFAVPSCPAARNVRYRIVGIGGGTGLTGVPTLSGTSGTTTATWEGEATAETNTFTFDTANPCKFTLQSNTANSSPLTGAFASSGVFVVRSPGGPNDNAGIGIGFPEQTIALSELAGTWNALEFSQDNGWKNFQNLLTLDNAGNFSNVRTCSGATSADNTCTTPSGAPTQLVANTKGGFDATGGGGHGARVFAFKSASGNLMLVVAVSPLDGGGLIIATPQTEQMTATVGDVSKGYYVSASPGTGTQLTTSFHSYLFTASASDATSSSWSATFDGTSDVLTLTDKWNQPRTGLGYRAAVPTHVAASIGMPIKGVGLTVRVSTGVNTSTTPAPFMTLSVRP